MQHEENKKIPLSIAIFEDKKNNLAVLGGEITNAYIFVIGQEESPDSEMLSEIKALAAKELGVDIQNICLEYI